jgi:sulfatase maturation enzyme AslB (radical SAM superfamily)
MFCPLPWTHLGVKNNGTLRMCSHSQSAGTGNTVLHHNGKALSIEDLDTVDVMNCETLKQVRKDILEGKWPEQCNRCKIEKAAGHRSRDQWETLRHQESFTQEMAVARTLEDGTFVDPEIQDMDLRVGNQCNLRCAMCFPGEATKWYKDYEEITGEDYFYVDGKKYNLIAKDGDFDWVRATEKVASLVRASSKLLKIKFGGGEPLMIKHHQQLIKGLIEAGYSNRIELEYSSNITVFPPELFDLWKHFKLIKICASLDALGEANSAIRYGTSWDTVKENLKMLDDTESHIEVFTSTTISLLSIEHYADLLLWLQNQNFKKINKNTFSVSASHPVYNPKYLNIAILEEHQQKRLFDKLRDKVKDFPELLAKIEFYDKYYNIMRVSEPELFRKQFAERFDRFAANQNQDWDSLFPEARRFANEWS